MFQTNQLATPLEEKMKAVGTSYRSIPTCSGARRHIPDPSVQQNHLTAQYATSNHWHQVLFFTFDKSVLVGLKRC